MWQTCLPFRTLAFRLGIQHFFLRVLRKLHGPIDQTELPYALGHIPKRKTKDSAISATRGKAAFALCSVYFKAHYPDGCLGALTAESVAFG